MSAIRISHICIDCQRILSFFFFNDTATTEIYTLSLHDALPISRSSTAPRPSADTPGLLARFGARDRIARPVPWSALSPAARHARYPALDAPLLRGPSAPLDPPAVPPSRAATPCTRPSDRAPGRGLQLSLRALSLLGRHERVPGAAE